MLMKKKLKFLIIIVSVVLLIGVSMRYFYTISSSKNWSSTKSDLEGKGFNFNFRDIIPSTVPDEKNFALANILKEKELKILNKPKSRISAPVITFSYEENQEFINFLDFQECFRSDGVENWNQPEEAGDPIDDVLIVINDVEKDLKLLEVAINERPLYNSNLDYKIQGAFIEAWNQSASSQLVHMNAQWWFLLRSHVLLKKGDSINAFKDVGRALFLTECFKNDPRLVVQTLRLSMLKSLLSPIWEGLAKGKWNIEQLEEIQKKLSSINIIEGISKGLNFDRHNLNQVHSYFRELAKQDTGAYRSGLISYGVPIQSIKSMRWFYISPLTFVNNSQSQSNKIYFKYIREGFDKLERRIYPEKLKELDQYLEENKFHPFNLISSLMMPSTSIMIRAGTVQVMLDHAYIASAIEAYKLRKGEYPKDLASLAIQLPKDVFSGQSYRYENDGNGLYFISSEGCDQNSDKKEIIDLQHSGKKIKTKKSNLVWHYPTSP